MAMRRGALRAAGDFVNDELDNESEGWGDGMNDDDDDDGRAAYPPKPSGTSRYGSQNAIPGGPAKQINPATTTTSRVPGTTPGFAGYADSKSNWSPAQTPLRRDRRPSLAPGETGKSGILHEIRGKKAIVRFVDVRRKHLQYFALKRTIGEKVLRKNLATRKPEALEYRVNWNRPVANLDLRLFRIALHEHARLNHSFRLESAQDDSYIMFRAQSFTEAKEWVELLKHEQEVYLDEQRHRSTALSLGLPPAEQMKPAMPILPTTYPGYELVEYFERKDMKFMISDILGSKVEKRNGFAILSFNLLANFYIVTTKRPEMYAHCDKGCLNWRYRSRRIIHHLITCDSDIICLQEVERWVFEDELMIALGSRGYTGKLECNKRKDGSEVPGTATFYKTKMFKEVWQERSYRSLLIGLQILEGPEKGSVLACANSHLEGNPLRAKDRASQIRGVFKKLERRKDEHRFVVLCGDYNDGSQSDLCQTVLAEQHFMSCYDNSEARDATCLLVPDDAKEADIEALRVDHIFFDSRLRVRAIMNVMNEAWSREGMIELGLPSLAWPSDHLSIGAIIEFNQDSEMFLVKEEQEEEQEVDPFEIMTSDEIFGSDAFNPLSLSERAVWLDHESSTTFENNGRPSPEEIERRKTASAAKEAFLKSLPEDKESFLRKIIALRRKEAKTSKKNKGKGAGKPQAQRRKSFTERLRQSGAAARQSISHGLARLSHRSRSKSRAGSQSSLGKPSATAAPPAKPKVRRGSTVLTSAHQLQSNKRHSDDDDDDDDDGLRDII